MKINTNEKPTDLVLQAIARILEQFWDLVAYDFATTLVDRPDECHVGHLFLAFVDVVGWLSDSEVWPLDFVILDQGGSPINLAEAAFSMARNSTEARQQTNVRMEECNDKGRKKTSLRATARGGSSDRVGKRRPRGEHVLQLDGREAVQVRGR